MCIAIYKPEDMLLSEETITNSWNNNPDGAGFMYVQDNKVVIEKGFMTLPAFLEAYTPHKDKQMALHFRIATHGKVNAANTHPFQVSDTLGVIHNGVMSNVKCNIDKNMSDTWHFVEHIMKPYEAHLFEPGFKELIESYIGYSKLVTLRRDGSFDIFNERLGDWDCQCWFSNKSYQTKKTPVQYRGHNKYKWQDAENDFDVGTPWGRDWSKTTNTGKSLVVGQDLKLLYDAEPVAPKFEGEKIKAKTKLTLDAFGHTNTLWVKTEDGTVLKIPTWKVDIWEEPKNTYEFRVGTDMVFTKNYNHFRIGMVKAITFVNEEYVGTPAEFGSKTKIHLIPKTHIKPAEDLIVH